MFSRAWVVLSAFVMLAACSLKTGDAPVENDKLRFNTARFHCLSRMGENIDRYMQGELNRAEVEIFVDCIRNALKQFEFHARGQDPQGYAPMEIAEFLNKNFNSKLTEPLVNEVMVVKTLIVGGTANFITRREYADLVNFLDVIQEEAVNNLPYVRLYRIDINVNQFDRVDPALLRAGKSQLVSTVNRLAEYLGRSGKPYSFASFENLVREGKRFLDWSERDEDTWAPEDLSELMSRFKEVMVGPDRMKIASKDWQPFLTSIAGVYGAYLDFEYLIKTDDILYGDGLEHFIQLADDTLGLLKSAIDRQAKRVIEFSAIFGLIDILDKMKLIPLNIRGESLKPSLQYTIQHVLKDPLSAIDPQQVTGLNNSSLTEARKEFYNWAESQRFLNDLALEELRKKSKQAVISTTDAVPFFGSLLKDFDLTLFFGRSAPEFVDNNIQYLVTHVTPLFRVGDNKVWIVPEDRRESYDIRHGLHDLGRLNVIRAVVRQLIRGFATPDRVILMATNPAVTGVTEDELESFYQTARSLGEDLLFMDPRKDEVGRRIFKEGNIFTFVGNGVQEPHADLRHLLNFTEIVEVISFMWSGGQVRDALYDRIKDICKKETGYTPENDIQNFEKIDRACFYRHVSDGGHADFINLPYMRDYLERLSLAERRQFYSRLSEISRIPTQRGPEGCYDDLHIELSEIATFATVMHYVESIFTIYDRDQNGILNEREIMSAFPRFRGFLSQTIFERFGDRHSVRMLKAIFAFIVRERRLPTRFREKASIKIDSWSYSNDPDVVDAGIENMSVDRLGILEILVMLNEESNGPRNGEPPRPEVRTCLVH